MDEAIEIREDPRPSSMIIRSTIGFSACIYIYIHDMNIYIYMYSYKQIKYDVNVHV